MIHGYAGTAENAGVDGLTIMLERGSARNGKLPSCMPIVE